MTIQTANFYSDYDKVTLKTPDIIKSFPYTEAPKIIARDFYETTDPAGHRIKTTRLIDYKRGGYQFLIQNLDHKNSPKPEIYNWDEPICCAGCGQDHEDITVHRDIEDILGDPDFSFECSDCGREIIVHARVKGNVASWSQLRALWELNCDIFAAVELEVR